MALTPNGIAALTLFVDDVARAREFYTRVFGLPVQVEDAESVVFAFGATLVNLLLRSAGPELVAPAPVAARDSGSAVVLTLPVADVDAACRDLEAAGVTLLNGPMDRPWGPRTASFTDPDGHVWELAG